MKTRLAAICIAIASPTYAQQDMCGAEGLQGLVGQRGVIADLLELDQMTRVLRPGDAMTMDLLPDRLNIIINEDDRIERVYCG